jgi:membrane protease YdiL (CAAX protease family)
VLGRLLPLVERGQAEGAFRSDVPAAWHLSMLMALVHAASAELRAGRVPEEHAEAALVATVLGAVATPRTQRTTV